MPRFFTAQELADFSRVIGHTLEAVTESGNGAVRLWFAGGHSMTFDQSGFMLRPDGPDRPPAGTVNGQRVIPLVGQGH